MGKLLFFRKDNNDYSEIIIEPSSGEPKIGEEAFKEFEEQLLEDFKRQQTDPWEQIAEQNRKNEERVKKERLEANKRLARQVRRDR